MQPRTRAAACTTAAAIFIIITLVALGFTVVISSLLPKQYTSFALLKIEVPLTSQIQSGSSSNKVVSNSSGPEAEFSIIQSSVVLDQVIGNLKLNEVWGKKYFNNLTLKTEESRALLKRQIDVRIYSKTPLIQIRAYSDDKNEAAKIANEIAEVYKKHRNKQLKDSNATNKAFDSDAYSGPPVQLIDLAEPAAKHSRPNLVVNLFLGGTLGAMIGAVVSGLFLFLVLRKPRRETPPPVPKTINTR